MRLLKNLTLLILVVIFVPSCKKDKHVTTPPVVYPNYAQLKTGNYWVYQEFLVDTAGNVITTNGSDSCYIEKDTIIGANTYYKMIDPGSFITSPVSFLRDSVQYLIDNSGRIMFSSQDFTSIFNTAYYVAGGIDTVAKIVAKMEDKDYAISVSAGTFTTSNYKKTYYMYPNFSSAGNPRYINKRYSENVGVITETLPFFATDPHYTEKRLLRYHVN